jgi:predicted transcriptional regulator
LSNQKKKTKTETKIEELLKSKPKLTIKEISEELHQDLAVISRTIKKDSDLYVSKIRDGSKTIGYVSLNPFILLSKEELQQNEDKIIDSIENLNDNKEQTLNESIPKPEPKIKIPKPKLDISTQERRNDKEYIMQLELENQQLKELQTQSQTKITLEDILKPTISERKLMGIFDLLFNKSPKGKNKKAIAKELIAKLQQEVI